MPGPDRIRVAAAQYPIDATPDFAAWRDKQARWIGEGAATGAALLVLPEYGLMELAAAAAPAVTGDVAASLAAVADLRTRADAAHAELARRHRVHLLAASGPAHRGDGRLVNAAHFFAPSGAMGCAEKHIMTPFERTWGISSGARPAVFDTGLGRIGVAICYDSEFPLLVRAQTEAGADLILIPSCTERLSGAHRIRSAALARALESQVATVVSPTIGEAPWSPVVDRNRGAAGIYVPAEHGLSDTGVLAEGGLDTPRWVVADIDFAALRALRAKGEMRNAEDWALQPGAVPLAQHAEVVMLA